ncbi:unnamed protein product, partial [Rotaria socialis]
PQNRSISSSSNSSKIWNWLTIAGISMHMDLCVYFFYDRLSVHMAWLNDYLVMVELT